MFESNNFSIDKAYKDCEFNNKNLKMSKMDAFYCTGLTVAKNIDKLYRTEGLNGIKKIYEYIELFNSPNILKFTGDYGPLGIKINEDKNDLMYDKDWVKYKDDNVENFILRDKSNNEYKLIYIHNEKNEYKIIKKIYLVGNLYIEKGKAYIFNYANPLLKELDNFIYTQDSKLPFEYNLGYLKKNLMNKELGEYIYISDSEESLKKIDKSKCKGIFHILNYYKLNDYTKIQSSLADECDDDNVKMTKNNYCSKIFLKCKELNDAIRKNGLNSVQKNNSYLELTNEIILERVKLKSHNLPSKNNPYYMEIYEDKNPITKIGYVLHDIVTNYYYIVRNINNYINIIGSLYYENGKAIIFNHHDPIFNLVSFKTNKNISKDNSKIYKSTCSTELLPLCNFMGYFKFDKLDSKVDSRNRMPYISIPKSSKSYVSESVSNLINLNIKKCKGFYINNSEIKIYGRNVVKVNANTNTELPVIEKIVKNTTSPFTNENVPKNRAINISGLVKRQNKNKVIELQNSENSTNIQSNISSPFTKANVPKNQVSSISNPVRKTNEMRAMALQNNKNSENSTNNIVSVNPKNKVSNSGYNTENTQNMSNSNSNQSKSKVENKMKVPSSPRKILNGLKDLNEARLKKINVLTNKAQDVLNKRQRNNELAKKYGKKILENRNNFGVGQFLENKIKIDNKQIKIMENTLLNKKLVEDNINSNNIKVDITKASNNSIDRSNVLTMHIKNKKNKKKYKLQYHISENSNIFDNV
jgi:hypothetical protein